MTAFFISLLLVLFFAGLLVMPVFRPRRDGYRYYVSGRSKTGDLLLRRRTLLENLRDLEIEHSHGKLADPEFEELAAPVAAELDQLEQQLQQARGTREADAARPSRHRLGYTCPACGRINHTRAESREADCEQCGTELTLAQPS